MVVYAVFVVTPVVENVSKITKGIRDGLLHLWESKKWYGIFSLICVFCFFAGGFFVV